MRQLRCICFVAESERGYDCTFAVAIEVRVNRQQTQQIVHEARRHAQSLHGNITIHSQLERMVQLR